MTDKKPIERRVIMAKTVASRWLENRVREEHRLTILGCAKAVNNLPNLLRSFRDGKVAMAGVEPLPDLGLQEEFDAISLWSSDRTALISLKDWCEKRGLETSGIW